MPPQNNHNQLGAFYERANIKYREQFQLALGKFFRILHRDRFNPHVFSIDQLDVTVPALDPAFEGYKIVQISDIHMGHWISPERLNGVVDLVNQQDPDIVVITGDFVSYVFNEIRAPLTKALQSLQPREAVLAVLGNHDHWLGPDKVRLTFAESGTQELANDVYTVQRSGARLHIAGVDDVIVGAADLEAVLARLPENGPAILLAHEPDYADISAATGRFFLQLSGHSHGGQVVIPGFGPILRGPYFLKYPLGLYQVKDMLQYTNRGIGTHVFRVRINCPPEITVIVLHNTAESAASPSSQSRPR